MNDNRRKAQKSLGLVSLAERPMKALTEKYIASFSICALCAVPDGHNENCPTPSTEINADKRTAVISHVLSGIVGCLIPVVALGVLYLSTGMSAMDVLLLTQDR